jgi:hypothetical protein
VISGKRFRGGWSRSAVPVDVDVRDPGAGHCSGLSLRFGELHLPRKSVKILFDNLKERPVRVGHGRKKIVTSDLEGISGVKPDNG